MSLLGLFRGSACGARNPDAPNQCTRPNEPNGHADGMHVDGTGHRMWGWIDDRGIHEALGMPDWTSPADEAEAGGRAR
jgi:hypothetical protein